MILTKELKEEIDKKTHYMLLRRIRFGSMGDDPLMQGESGEYWCQRREVMRERDPGRAVLDSKLMGWGR